MSLFNFCNGKLLYSKITQKQKKIILCSQNNVTEQIILPIRCGHRSAARTKISRNDNVIYRIVAAHLSAIFALPMSRCSARLPYYWSCRFTSCNDNKYNNNTYYDHYETCCCSRVRIIHRNTSYDVLSIEARGGCRPHSESWTAMSIF